MTLNKDGLEAAHAAYAKTTGGMLEGHPMANAITAYLAARPAPDHAGLASRVFYPVNNPSAWPDGFNQNISDLLREAATALSAASPAPLEGVRVKDTDLIDIVSNLARAAWNLCDGTANENPPEVDQQDWDRLSAALDRIEALPPVPGVVAGPGAKIEYALLSAIVGSAK